MVKKEAVEIKKNWPLEPINGIERFHKGAINNTYKVSTSNNKVYVLRVYNNKSAEEIKFEIDLLVHLKNLPVPGIIKFNNKRIFRVLDKPAVIYNYIPGKQLSSFKKKHLKQIGEFLGKFHEQGKNFKWEGTRNKYYHLPENKVKLYKKEIQKKGVKYSDLLPSIMDDLKKNRPGSWFQQGPIHIDIKPDNILFHKDELNGILDFDNSYIGPLLLDVAKTMIWFGMENQKFNLEKPLIIFQAYNSVKKIPEKERQSLLSVMKYAFCSHLFVDFYMMAKGRIPAAYFEYLMNDFYNCYQDFSSQEENYKEEYVFKKRI